MITGTIAPVSTRETWREGIELRDADDGTLLNVSAEVDQITVRVREQDDSSAITDGYRNTGSALTSWQLEATLTGGTVTILASGIISFIFTATQMNALCSGNYTVGCLVTFKSTYGGDTVQLILGDISIIKGL